MKPLAVTVRQAAQALAVSDRTIRRLLSSGELVEVRVRGARRVQYASLEAVGHADPESKSAEPKQPSVTADRDLDAQLMQRIKNAR